MQHDHHPPDAAAPAPLRSESSVAGPCAHVEARALHHANAATLTAIGPAIDASTCLSVFKPHHRSELLHVRGNRMPYSGRGLRLRWSMYFERDSRASMRSCITGPG